MARYQLFHSIIHTFKELKKLFLIFSLVIGGCIGGYFAGTISSFFLCDRFSPSHLFCEDSSRFLPLPHNEETIPYSLLNQDFFYLGKGSQSYAFVNEESGVVLKFVRYSRYRLPFLVDDFPLPQFLKEILKEKRLLKEKKLERFLTSCTIASEQLKDECSLLWMHLNPFEDSSHVIKVHDALGRAHLIPLKNTSCFLQKKGELVFPYLDSLKEQGKTEELREALLSILSLIHARCQKGIRDDDASLYKNMGFVDEKPFFIDVGEFSYDETEREPEKMQTTYRNLLGPLEVWMRENSPFFISMYEKAITDNFLAQSPESDSN